MNGGKNRKGYTIVEVMIVLAVSGIIFLIAVNFVNGKQAKTAFATGSNALSAQFQDVATQVQNGQFSDVNFGCTSTVAPVQFNSNVSQGQGTNSGCVFVGKIIHFSVNGDPTKYNVMMLAGIDGISNYSTVIPITPAADSPSHKLDLTKHFTNPQNLIFKRVSVGAYTPPTPPQQVFALGFLQDVTAGSSNQLTLAYLPLAQISSNQDEATAAAQIHGNLSTTDRAYICVTDGARYAVIEFGGDANGGSTINAKLKVTTSSDPLCA